MRTPSNLYTSITSWFARRKVGNRIQSSWLHIILIISVVVFIYFRSFEGEFLNVDDIRNLSSALARPPQISFINHSYVWFSYRFYRPLFLVQAWLFYQLFGLSFAPMQACILGMHALTSVIVYQVIKKMSGSNSVGLLTALVYASSYVIGILVANWVTDTAPLTNLLFAITLFLLVTPSDKMWWYVVLFCCLLLAPISRENGLVILGSVGLYTLYNGYWGDYIISRVRAILLTCILAFVLYFSLRTLAVGIPDLPPAQDSPPSVIAMNFVAVFAPLIQAYDLGPNIGNVVFGIVHSLLSIMVVFGLISGWGTIPRRYRAIIFLGSVLIVLGSIIPFIYFRYRNLNSAYFGWLILLATFLSQRLPNFRYQITRRVIYGTVVSLIILSGLMIMFRLPISVLTPTIENSQVLCNKDVSEDLAIEIVNWNGFEVEPILDCRK